MPKIRLFGVIFKDGGVQLAATPARAHRSAKMVNTATHAFTFEVDADELHDEHPLRDPEVKTQLGLVELRPYHYDERPVFGEKREEHPTQLPPTDKGQ